MFLRRTRAALIAIAVSTTLLAATTPATATTTTNIPEGGVVQALANYAISPGAVAGANDWTCRPSREHPNPVILLPGSFFNIGANFVKAAPRLANNGYCVFAMNYGFTQLSFDRVGGLAPITTSAKELANFVAKVRTATGAAKVDIIGHSQGGSVAMWWLKKMGGAEQTAHYVGWAPSSHGTSLNGIVTLGSLLNLMGFVTGIADVAQFSGATDQAYTSEYTKALWADGDTVPAGPRYTVIATKFDRVVTPYRSQLLSGPTVTNIVLQDKCPLDVAGHIGLFNDDPTLQMTMNALADGPANFRPRCVGFGVPLL